VNRPEKPRVPALEPDEWTDEIKEVLGRTGDVGSGGVLNIFKTLAHHPKLMKRWLVFGAHVLSKNELPPRERELVILRVGWLCQAKYEWAQHVVIGKQTGITDEEIERLCDDVEAPGWSDPERLLLRATDELHHDHCITDATWQQLTQHFTTQAIIDLVFTVGQYTLVSMALNSLGAELDAGLEGFPKGKQPPGAA